MNTKQILKDIEKVLLRYRAGLISLDQSKQELSLLSAMLKAYESTVMEEKIERLEAVIEGRR
jgi:hypothetical protein